MLDSLYYLSHKIPERCENSFCGLQNKLPKALLFNAQGKSQKIWTDPMYGAVNNAWKKWEIGEPHSWEIFLHRIKKYIKMMKNVDILVGNLTHIPWKSTVFPGLALTLALCWVAGI